MSAQQYQSAMQQVQGNFPSSVTNSPYVQPFQFSQVSSPWNSMASQLKAMPNYNSKDYVQQQIQQALQQTQRQAQFSQNPNTSATR